MMELIERYLYEVGTRLPPNQRKDILNELRSSLEDSLDARTDGAPTEEEVVVVLKEMGPPKEVAASYSPEKQYLIGPNLYPVFRLVVGITFVAIIGAQLVAIAVAFFLAGEPFNIEQFLGILNSLPAALGFVVIIFFILERLDVDFEEDEEPQEFDPRKLQPVEYVEPVSRGEQAFSIIVGVIVLTWLAIFVSRSGFSGVEGPDFFTNPVIEQYLVWIGLSMIVSIVVDIVLLWQGRWTIGLRVAKIAANLFSLVVLGLLLQGHNIWLADIGVVGYLDWLPRLADLPALDNQLIGMAVFRMVFAIAFIITLIETIVQLFRIGQSWFRLQRADVISYGKP